MCAAVPTARKPWRTVPAHHRLKASMNNFKILAITGLSILGIAASTTNLAATRMEIDERVAATVKEFNALHADNAALARKAAGVLVFPRITKAGVGVAAEFGEGVLQVDGKTIGYYSIGAGSVGLTLGLAKHSEVIMFMNQQSLDKFTSSKGWSIGADAGVTVVSKSASGQYDSAMDKKPILAFGFAEKGLIADLSLDGTKITEIKK
jgi:lipid-binding SYLF domain-containing protein